MSRRTVAMLALLAAATAAGDTVYRDRDAQGRPVFTDQPAPGAEQVDVPPVNTLPPVTPRPRDAVSPEQEAGYQRVSVAVPSIIPNGLAPVTMAVQPEPALHDGHRWRLVLDGVLVAESDDDSGVTFPQLERGEHVVAAEIVDADGRIVAESGPIPFFVYWPGGNR